MKKKMTVLSVAALLFVGISMSGCKDACLSDYVGDVTDGDVCFMMDEIPEEAVD